MGFEPLVAPLPAPAVAPDSCATYRHRRPNTPYMAGLTGYLLSAP
jgi:hypothetical protein